MLPMSDVARPNWLTEDDDDNIRSSRRRASCFCSMSVLKSVVSAMPKAIGVDGCVCPGVLAPPDSVSPGASPRVSFSSDSHVERGIGIGLFSCTSHINAGVCPRQRLTILAGRSICRSWFSTIQRSISLAIYIEGLVFNKGVKSW